MAAWHYRQAKRQQMDEYEAFIWGYEFDFKPMNRFRCSELPPVSWTRFHGYGTYWLATDGSGWGLSLRLLLVIKAFQ